jgi:hypothetical protein
MRVTPLASRDTYFDSPVAPIGTRRAPDGIPIVVVESRCE